MAENYGLKQQINLTEKSLINMMEDSSTPTVGFNTERDNVLNKDETEETVPGASWKDHLLEPFMFLYSFCWFMGASVSGNLYMQRACSLDFDYPAEICSNLTGNDSIQDEIQIFSTTLSMYSMIVTLVPGAIMAIFIGPWSDMYGRITPIVISLVGGVIRSAGYITFSVRQEIPAYYTLVVDIPGGSFGGLICVLAALYSLATEKSRASLRTKKYATMEGAYYLGMVLGGLVAGQIYGSFGPVPVYCTQLVLLVTCLVFVLSVIRDNRLGKKVASYKTKVKDFFSTERLNENVIACFKKREGTRRAQLLMLIFSISSVLVVYSGMGDLLFYFCNKVYGWDLRLYTTVSNVSAGIAVVFVIFLVIFLTRKLKLKDAGLGTIGVACLTGQCFLRAFAFDPSLLYISYAVGSAGGLAPLAIRARMSKLVDKDEIGKVFAILAILESLIPVAATAVFTAIYNATLSYYPGLMFLCSGSLMVPPLLFFLWLIRHPISQMDYKTLDENKEGTESSQHKYD